MLAFLALYLLTINAVTFAAFASDKRRAVAGVRRVPERTLLELATFGGSVGALAAQRLLRHKTKKEPFRTQLWFICAVQTLAVVIAVVLWAQQ